MKLCIGLRSALVVAVALISFSVIAESVLPSPITNNGNDGLFWNKKLKLVEVFSGLNATSPTNLIFGSNCNNKDQVYVAEESGVIYTFTKDGDETKDAPVVFMNLQNKMTNYDSLTLHSLAFHPKFPDLPYFFIYYSWHEPGSLYITTILSRFRVFKDDPNMGDLSSEEPLIELTQPRGSHTGGSLLFASWDGYLYLSLGDGGRYAFDPFTSSQNPNSFFGKVLRLDVGQPEGYSIPIDNPFVSGGALPEIYALGFRNPWRCTADSLTETILCGDMGDLYWEELNVLVSGKNYGWNIMEGPGCYVDNHCKKYLFELPIFSYPHPSHNSDNESFNGSSIIGGYIYRGNKISWLTGTYVFADYTSRKIGGLVNTDWSLEVNELIGSDDLVSNIMAFGVDNNQELYVLFEGNYPIMKLKKKFFSCGNGSVEDSEQCDLGEEPTDLWKEKNCDPLTCLNYPHPGEA